jgi:NADPH:quinone reductase-like Zn-dependent oxidoreductase
VDLSYFVVNGSIWLYQHGDRRVERGVAHAFGHSLEFSELPGPGELRPDEVLLEVRCAGVGNWDDIARTGGWDLGRQPPMALGAEAADVATRTGGAVAGDRVMTHSLALRAQGAWAEWFVAAASDAAPVPDAVPFEVAAALPVPALTADQVLRGALGARPGATVLVHGAGRLWCCSRDRPAHTTPAGVPAASPA